MPQNRAQYTFGQLVSLVEELKSSVNNLQTDFDKLQESNHRLERRLAKVENNSNDDEVNLSTSDKKFKREEIKREMLDYKEDISCDQIEPADIQSDLLSLEAEPEASHPKQELNTELQERRKRRNGTNVDVKRERSGKLLRIKAEIKAETNHDAADVEHMDIKDSTLSRGTRRRKEEGGGGQMESLKVDNFCHHDGGGGGGRDGGEAGCRCGVSHTEDHMIGCDGPCGRWFHYDCVGISDTFTSRASWYCETCFLQLSGGGVEVCLCREWWEAEHELVRCSRCEEFFHPDCLGLQTEHCVTEWQHLGSSCGHCCC